MSRRQRRRVNKRRTTHVQQVKRRTVVPLVVVAAALAAPATAEADSIGVPATATNSALGVPATATLGVPATAALGVPATAALEAPATAALEAPATAAAQDQSGSGPGEYPSWVYTALGPGSAQNPDQLDNFGMSAGLQAYTPEGGGGVAAVATTTQGGAIVISGGTGVGAQATFAAGPNVTIPSYPLQLVANVGGAIDGGKASATLTVPFTSSLGDTINNTSLNLAFGANPFPGLRVSITCNAQGCSPAAGWQYNTANAGMSLDNGATGYLALRATIPLPPSDRSGPTDANGVFDVTNMYGPAMGLFPPEQTRAERDLSQFAGVGLPQWAPDGSFMGYVTSNADGSVTLHTATADVTTYQGSVLIHQLIDSNTGQRTDQWIQQSCNPGCSGPTTTFDVATNTLTEANTPDGSTITLNRDTGVVTQTNEDGSTVTYDPNPTDPTITTSDGGLVWGIGATTTTYHLLPDGSVGSVTQTGPSGTTTWDSSGQATISNPLGGTVTSSVIPPPTPPPIPEAPVLTDPSNSVDTVTPSTAGTDYAYSTDANGNDVVTITAPSASNTSNPSSTAASPSRQPQPPASDNQSNTSNQSSVSPEEQATANADGATPGAVPQPTTSPQPPASQTPTPGTCWSTTGDGQPQSPDCQPPTTGDGQPQSTDSTDATPVNTNPTPTPDTAGQPADNTGQTGTSNPPANGGPGAQPGAPPAADQAPAGAAGPAVVATTGTQPASTPTENTVVQALTSAPASPPSNSTSTDNMVAQAPAPSGAPGSNGNAGLNSAATMTTTTNTLNGIMDSANASNNANTTGSDNSNANADNAAQTPSTPPPGSGGGGGSPVGGDDGQQMAEMDA